MLLITHLSSGYVLYNLLGKKLRYFNKKKTLQLFLLSSSIPDIDGFFRANIANHRKTIFHAPLIYLALLTLTFLWGLIKKKKNLKTLSLIFFCGLTTHFFLDLISSTTTGLWIFYPFSDKFYHFFPVRPDIGNIMLLPGKGNISTYLELFKFYINNKVILFSEISILILGITQYIFVKRKDKAEENSLLDNKESLAKIQAGI